MRTNVRGISGWNGEWEWSRVVWSFREHWYGAIRLCSGGMRCRDRRSCFLFSFGSFRLATFVCVCVCVFFPSLCLLLRLVSFSLVLWFFTLLCWLAAGCTAVSPAFASHLMRDSNQGSALHMPLFFLAITPGSRRKNPSPSNQPLPSSSSSSPSLSLSLSPPPPYKKKEGEQNKNLYCN